MKDEIKIDKNDEMMTGIGKMNIIVGVKTFIEDLKLLSSVEIERKEKTNEFFMSINY